MKTQLEARLATLKSEYELGQNKLAELEKRGRELETTLIRISGAIQVVEELLAQADSPAEAPVAQD